MALNSEEELEKEEDKKSRREKEVEIKLAIVGGMEEVLLICRASRRGFCVYVF